MRKPTTAAWLIHSLARHHHDEVRLLLDLGAQLRGRLAGSTAQCDVVIVCKPVSLTEHSAPVQDVDRPWKEARPAPLGYDFHELLKARSLRSDRSK